MNEWSIKIVSSGGVTSFSPRARQTLAGDMVSWGNTTDETHQPWPFDDEGNPLPASQVARTSANYLSDHIPPDNSSRPSYIVPTPPGNPPPLWVLNYGCACHPTSQSERGQIFIAAPAPDADDTDS